MGSLVPVSAELVMHKAAAGIRFSDHLGVKTMFECKSMPERRRQDLTNPEK